MKIPVLLVALSAVLLAACSTVTAKRDMDPKARFDQYKTYAWAPEPHAQALASSAVDETIRAAADEDLTAKGWTKVAGKTPDVYLVYHVTSPTNSNGRDYNDWGLGKGFRPGYGTYTGWTGQPATSLAIDKDKEGALILDIVEVRRNQLAWRGVASAVLLPNSSANVSRARQAVHLLLSEFPPPPNLPAH